MKETRKGVLIPLHRGNSEKGERKEVILCSSERSVYSIVCHSGQGGRGDVE